MTACSTAEDVDTTERPLCECHGEPMHRNGSDEGRRRWICAQFNRARNQAQYDALTGVEYNRLLLRRRRVKALARRRRRAER